MNLLIRVKLNVIPSGALMNYYGHISTSETKPRIFFLKSAVVHCRLKMIQNQMNKIVIKFPFGARWELKVKNDEIFFLNLTEKNLIRVLNTLNTLYTPAKLCHVTLNIKSSDQVNLNVLHLLH